MGVMVCFLACLISLVRGWVGVMFCFLACFFAFFGGWVCVIACLFSLAGGWMRYFVFMLTCFLLHLVSLAPRRLKLGTPVLKVLLKFLSRPPNK